MSGQASSSQLNISLSGSSAMSHVYIQYPPLHCSIPESRGLYYDDGNKLLLSPMANQVFSWKVVPFTPHNDPASDTISEGPILSIRYSLDEKYIAIQRSGQEIQIWCKESGETFSYSCRSELDSILGFFWTDCPLGDIVIVKTSGLEIFSCDSESKSLHLIETRRLNVSWYVYTHESRLVLLASGMQCTNFNGFQLSAAGIVRLPKFEMVMAKAETNSKPVLAAEDVYIATIYGRIYCMQIDRVAMLLRSYRFYRDAVVQQGSFPIYSSKIAVSVVDNVLLIHQVDAKVVILYDIFSDSRAPISAPLPLLLRGLPRSNTSPSISREGESSVANNVSDHEAIIYGEYWTFLVPDLICDVTNKLLWKINLDVEAISASSSEVPSVIEFLQRRKLEANKVKQLCFAIVRSVILERRPVSMVAKAIDVLVSSYSYSIKMGCHVKGVKVEKPSPSDRAHVSSPRSSTNISTGGVGEFGKSMKHESSAGLGDDSLDRPLNFSASDSEDGDSTDLPKVVKEYSSGADGSCADVRPFSSQSQQFGMGNSSLNAIDSEQLESQVTSPAISPDEMYSFVFAPVEEEMVGDSSYLVTIIVEFLRSANVEKIKVDPNIYVLLIQLIARNERYAELTLFVVNKIIEPSKEVAMQLLESGRQNFQTRKLGMDMLRQLSLHHDYALQLVQDGYYLEALRYVRKFKVITIRPSLFLEAALASNDSGRLAAVMRFFTDFVPGFRQTLDHHAYYRILHEMNSSVAS